MAALVTPAHAQRLVTYGDSITAGQGLTSAQMYANELGATSGLPVVNRAVSGSMMADQAMDIYKFQPAPTDTVTVMLGTNDQRWYGISAARRSVAIEFLRSIIVAAAAPVKTPGTAWTYSSGWAPTGFGYFGIRTSLSSVVGETATTTVCGPIIWLTYIASDISNANSNSAATVSIDGSVVDTIATNESGIAIVTYLGQQWAPATRRYATTTGIHTVKVTTTTGGQYFWLEQASGSCQAPASKVYVSNIIPISASGQTAISSPGGTDANIANYNNSIASLVSEVAADGLSVSLVNNNSMLILPTDYQADGIHPNAGGDVKVANDFYAAFPQPTYVDAKIQVDSVGNFYGVKADGTGRVKLQAAP